MMVVYECPVCLGWYVGKTDLKKHLIKEHNIKNKEIRCYKSVKGGIPELVEMSIFVPEKRERKIKKVL